MFSVRVVSVDHYISKPIAELYGDEEDNFIKDWQEPVIRIFGATPDGIKSCVHVHGVYPYIYVPYKGGDNPERDALLLGAALDEALKTSFNAKIGRYVHEVILISGIPLYGYHSNHRKFFKIYFFNPFHIKRASGLLLSGAILGQKLQPHEAHIPYALQFMMDYNIYGMSFVTFSRVKYRRNFQNPDSMVGINDKDILPAKVKKIACSQFEVDALANDISNRIGQSTEVVNPGLQAIWEDEKALRRLHGRPSPVTVSQSQSRPEARTHPIEAGFRDRLAQKLREVSRQGTQTEMTCEERKQVYPAEVPEDEDILEASAVVEGLERPRPREEVADVGSLLDEETLARIIGKRELIAASESEEDETEADSVLGRSQKAEEEAELDDEEGVDMTQPLDAHENDIRDAEGNRDESGRGSPGSNEESFWRSMAERICQLDGAQESSSESDVEAAPPGPPAPVLPEEPEPTSEGPLEFSSTWSTNIMSILSEDSGCPTPSTICQTPRTFWSNYSPDWLPPHKQDPASWNRNGELFLDASQQMPDLAAPPKDVQSGAPYLDFFGSNDGEFLPPSAAVTLLCGVQPAPSPPSADTTLRLNGNGSDINLDSICGSLKVSPPEGKSSFAQAGGTTTRKAEGDRQKFLRVLKSFAGKKGSQCEEQCCHLTLKQYIKDCKEIVSVDFKTLCNQEMIIIEYKSRNRRSLQNKYLIKPLEKFLESWNSAERKVRGQRSKVDREDGKKWRSVRGVVGCHVGETSRVQSLSNKLTVRAMEILPEDATGKTRCYNVNGNVISQGKIKMKLMKSRGENLKEDVLEETLTRERRERCGNANIEEKRAGRRGGKSREWKTFSELDTKLINEINSSFEEYFKSLVKRKSFLSRRTKSVVEEVDEVGEIGGEGEEYLDGEGEGGVDEDDEDDEDKGVGEESSEDEKMTVRSVRPSASADPIKFVTRFLSTFSRMSDLPPFSVTISLGSPRASVPVQVNLQPIGTPSGAEVMKCYSKKQRRRMKVENVDGPADGSSSSESGSGGDSKGKKTRGQKRRKKEAYYKPLNVVVYGSPCVKKVAGKTGKVPDDKEKTESKARATAKAKAKTKTKAKVEKLKHFSSADGFGVFRERSDSRTSRSREEEKASTESLVSGEKNSKEAEFPGSNGESDFIEDSDEERWQRPSGSCSDSKLRRPRWARVSSKSATRGIPQADTEAFTSQDDDDDDDDDDDEDKDDKEVKRIHERFDRSKCAQAAALPSSVLMPCLDSVSSDDAKEKALWSAETAPRCDLVPGSSLWSNFEMPNDDSTASFFPQSASPLVLSGDPLFASGSNSPEPDSSELVFSTGHDEEKVGSGSGQVGLDWVCGHRMMVPARKPPSRWEAVESMRHYGILKNSEEAPFYSDPRDATKAVATGPRRVKIENRTLAGLKTFQSSLDVSGTEERRNLAVTGDQTERCRLVADRDVTIVPLRQPPSPKAVLEWLSRKADPEKREEKPEPKRIKVMKPVSPGKEGDSAEEMELSLSVSDSAVERFWEKEDERDAIGESELELKKGPLSRVKGMKKVLLEKKLQAIVEEEKEATSGPSGFVPDTKSSGNSDNSFQIRGVTLDKTYGFSNTLEKVQHLSASNVHQYMDMFVMEVHVRSREDLLPDPDYDPIRALFYAVAFDSPTRNQEAGIVVVGDHLPKDVAISGLAIHLVPTEEALIEKVLALVRDYDPEILAGYEIEMHSWGYLVQRGLILQMNLLSRLSRVEIEDLTRNKGRESGEGESEAEDLPWCVRHMKVPGRIVLDIWRVLRHEVSLTSYSFENVMYHLLHERHPLLSHKKLSLLWEHPGQRVRHLVVEHYATRVLGILRILHQVDFIGRTSELSRLFGIQFYEVLSRGSQFRVESMLLRLAKPLNYIAVSPSVAQRAAMRAPASLPLILEPESLFYSDPVIVLDFQSLYPSIMIAYNYCFSTCLGRVENLGEREPFEFGCSQLQVSPEKLKSLEKELTISPAGVAFVNSTVRKGLLPSMLAEILETRLMVKKSMKENKGNKALQKVLFSRQLGLKLIANVTYGYTAANFSGRMPCIEVGDSVVSKGRETLYRAIQLVQSTEKWGARVVYGDTDSIFVMTPGRSREEAFKIGAEIAEAVTRDNPKPVKLKLEKVYQPSILQTKKRYLGYMYESPEQKEPVFEAKGIETVRRDGCPATGKVLEKAIRILFETRDVSLVRKYTVRQFAKLFQGRVNLQDLIFAKEYRGRKGYRRGACVPALHLAKQWTQKDKRAEPRVKERVPYVIVNGPPGVPLIRLVRSPTDLMSEPGLRINAVYYITKALVPAMQRCFSLLGADVMSWYAEMPRKLQKNYRWGLSERQKKTTISQYFATTECVVCCQLSSNPICPRCEDCPQVAVVYLAEKIRRWERSHEGLLQICRSCCGRPSEIECVSLDCPVLFRRGQAAKALEQEPGLRAFLADLSIRKAGQGPEVAPRFAGVPSEDT